MDCGPEIWDDSEGFWRALREQAEERRIPLCGGLGLTTRCNLHCAHCFLGPQRHTRDAETAPELRTDRILSILDEVTEAGCLFMLLTGGEPLLHPDFAEIYAHARTRGLNVTVFTNGTLVDDATIALFREYPPKVVEVSLYGATAATYERISGVPGSHARCLAGIRRLYAGNIRLVLKTTLMTLNRDEIPAMREFARSMGLQLRMSPGIIPTLDGEQVPLALRVSPDEAVRIELEEEGRLEEWQDSLARAHRKGPRRGDSLYRCAAGLRSFYINDHGFLRPCQMTQDISYDLKQGDFLTGWQEISRRTRALKAPPDCRCTNCESMTLCPYCPPAFRLETGDAAVPSDHVCVIGRKRHEAVKTCKKKDPPDGERYTERRSEARPETAL
jgi:MoaA/NifB/PqqE/SkfB family radical SAM enzyme